MRKNEFGHHAAFLPGPADSCDVVVQFLANAADADNFGDMRGFEEQGLPGVGLTVYDIEKLVLLTSAATIHPDNVAELLQFVRETFKL